MSPREKSKANRSNLIPYLNAGSQRRFRAQRQLPERTRLYALMLIGVAMSCLAITLWALWREFAA